MATLRPAGTRSARLEGWTFQLRPALYGVALFVITIVFVGSASSIFVDQISGLACIFPVLSVLTYATVTGYQLARPTFGFIVVVMHGIFFGAGFLNYLLNGRHLQLGAAGIISATDVASVIVPCSAISTAIGISALAAEGKRSSQSTEQRWIADRRILALQQILVIISLSGAVFTLVQYGGIVEATAALSSHDRSTVTDSGTGLGGSLWGVFSVPALTTTAVSLFASRSRLMRTIMVGEIALLLAYALAVTGSRLTFLLFLISVFVAYPRVVGREIPVVLLVGSLAVFLLISNAVLNARATTQGQSQSTTTVLDSLGYSIFDVAVASQLQGPELGNEVASPARAITVLSTALPNGLLNNTDAIANNRLDRIFVQALGAEAQAQGSALPPSVPVALWLGFGSITGLLLGVAFGGFSGVLLARLQTTRARVGPVFYVLTTVFLINTFKDGDIALNAGSQLRTIAYVLVIYGVVSLIEKRLR